VSLSFHESTPPKATFTHTWTRKRPNADYAVVIETGDAATLTPALVYRRWLAEHGQLVTLKQKIAANANVQRLLGAPHAYLWGDGVSVAMLDTIHRSGIDRFVLCTGDLDFASLKPEVAARAAELGYLFGPYDSYDSVHSPDADPDDTWTTAQFDRKLYETGRVIGADGEARRGFKGVGYRLSPLAAKPYVRRRVEERLAKVPYSAWFVDCDAFGEFLEDYSPEHPATRIDDARARRQRLRWLSEEHGLVVGSEGGTAVMTAAIHFGHGVMTPVIGWGDERLTSRDSEYFLGAWWPPDAPGVFFKRVPLCPDYARPYFDPRDRLPLYQAVFGDCVIATHHWTAASLKFADQLGTVELLELLYNVPPLYHLNREQWLRDEARTVRHFAFWSPIHRALALAPLVGFEHLTPDRLVQRTTFAADAGRVHLIANFDRVERTLANGQCLPPRSLTVTGALRLDQPVFVVGD
jgi:hypothetical protein